MCFIIAGVQYHFGGFCWVNFISTFQLWRWPSNVCKKIIPTFLRSYLVNTAVRFIVTGSWRTILIASIKVDNSLGMLFSQYYIVHFVIGSLAFVNTERLGLILVILLLWFYFWGCCCCCWLLWWCFLADKHGGSLFCTSTIKAIVSVLERRQGGFESHLNGWESSELQVGLYSPVVTLTSYHRYNTSTDKRC